MRIAVIAPPWVPVPPSRYGGIEVVVNELALGYQAAGHDVLLFTTGDSECPVPRRWVFGQAQTTLMGRPVPEVRHVIHAYEAAEDFDIVHDHTLLGPLYAPRFPNLRVAATIHDAIDGDYSDVLSAVASRVKLIAISVTQCEAAPGLRVAAVIHHGLDASRFPFQSEGGDYALFLGRMAPEKGAHVAAWAATRAGVPLVLAGRKASPEEQTYYRDQVEPHVHPDMRIFYVGEVEDDRKRQLLAGARCLLFPIRWKEPFGLVLLEAMACGTPVIAFGHGAVPEIVEHGRTGFICRDEREMVRAMARVGELDRALCRKAVEGHFSADRMVHDHLELFERLRRNPAA